jgi:thioredoxin reductase
VAQKRREIRAFRFLIAIGFEPETALLRGLVELDPMGHAPVDLYMQTSLPGLFAVSTARQGNSGQLSSVAGDGVTAAISSTIAFPQNNTSYAFRRSVSTSVENLF